MQIAFRLAYSLVVAILLVLFVILGIRTFYDEPEGPEFPEPPPPVRAFAFKEPGPPSASIECEPDGRCFDPTTGRTLTEAEVQERQQAQREFEEEQRQFQEELQQFEEERQVFIEEERAPYHRNVFILASVLGVAAIAAGLYLFRRVEAMPLGLMLGGLGVVIFAWAQAAEDFGEIGAAPLFAAAAVGLAVVLGMGYWFLGAGRTAGQGP